VKSSALSALAFAALVSLSAMAYVLPGWSILRRMGEARDEAGVSSLRIDGTVSFFGPFARDAAAVLHLAARVPDVQSEGAVLLKVPGRCRMEAWGLDGSKVAAVFSNGRKRVEGPLLAPLAAAVEATCPTVAIRSSSSAEQRVALEHYLDALKIDFRHPSLGRLGGQVAFVLGAPGDLAPQLWVYKDTFEPARIRWADGQQAIWEVRWLDYRSPITGDLFPRMMEVFRNGELGLRFTALKADAQVRISDKLY
jgi:hypothetical protein